MASRMLNLVLILVSVISINHFEICHAGNVDKINRYLVEKTESKDLQSNLKIARELLASESEKRIKILNGGLIENLKTFISLGDVEHDASHCNGKSSAILRANNKMLDSLRERVGYDGLEYPTRVEKLVWEVMKEHAIRCRPVYVDNFNKIVANSKPMMKALRDLHEALMSTSTSYDYYDDEILHSSREGSVDIPYEALIQLSKAANDDEVAKTLVLKSDELSGKPKINQEQVNLALKKYVLEPCKWYNDTFEADIINPSLFDTSVVSYELNHEMMTLYDVCEQVNKNRLIVEYS